MQTNRPEQWLNHCKMLWLYTADDLAKNKGSPMIDWEDCEAPRYNVWSESPKHVSKRMYDDLVRSLLFNG